MSKKPNESTRPFDPSRATPLIADAETTDAVRKVITDWDGKNWQAVFQTLRNAGRTPDEIVKMTVFDVRMAFATGQIVLARAIGGALKTATHSIQKINFDPMEKSAMVVTLGAADSAGAGAIAAGIKAYNRAKEIQRTQGQVEYERAAAEFQSRWVNHPDPKVSLFFEVFFDYSLRELRKLADLNSGDQSHRTGRFADQVHKAGLLGIPNLPVYDKPFATSLEADAAYQKFLAAVRASIEGESRVAATMPEPTEVILDRPIIRPPGQIRVQIQGGGLFTDGKRFDYGPYWSERVTADYDEILFLWNGKPFLYHRATRPRLERDSAEGDAVARYFDVDSTIRELSTTEAVRWFERYGRDVPAELINQNAAGKPSSKNAAEQAISPDVQAVKPDPIAVAVTMKANNPRLSVRNIAKAVGMPHSTLASSRLWKAAADRMKQVGAGKMRRGSKSKDGQIEAIDD